MLLITKFKWFKGDQGLSLRISIIKGGNNFDIIVIHTLLNTFIVN